MRVVVIGAGIVGVSAALELARAGVEVIVVERGSVAGEASGLNAGVVGGGGWGDEPDLEVALKMGSRDHYLDLDERGRDIGLDRAGTLTLIRAETEWAWAAELVRTERARGRSFELLGRRELIELEPAADPQLLGAVFDPLAVRAEPVAATRATAAEAVAAGARIETGVAVERLRPVTGGGWEVGVAGWPGDSAPPLPADAGADLGADAVILAAGPWCAELGRLAGVEIPIAAVRGQMWASAPRPPMLRHAVAAAESPLSWQAEEGRPGEPPNLTHRAGRRRTRHLYGRQRPNGEIVFGGDRVLAPDPVTDRAVDPDGIAVNHAHVAELLPAVHDLPPVRTWAGLMPFSLDGHPLLGPVPDRTGLYVAGGLASSGFGRGPMAGRIVAGLVLDHEPPVELGLALLDGRVTELGSG